jgi:hypothetical protein
MILPFWESGGLQRIGSSASRWICFLYDLPSSGITMFVDMGRPFLSISNAYIWSVPLLTSVPLRVLLESLGFLKNMQEAHVGM